MGISMEGSIARLSMQMSHQNTMEQAQVKMLSKTLDASEQSALSLVEDLSQITPSASAGTIGAVLDVKA